MLWITHALQKMLQVGEYTEKIRQTQWNCKHGLSHTVCDKCEAAGHTAHDVGTYECREGGCVTTGGISMFDATSVMNFKARQEIKPICLKCRKKTYKTTNVSKGTYWTTFSLLEHSFCNILLPFWWQLRSLEPLWPPLGTAWAPLTTHRCKWLDSFPPKAHFSTSLGAIEEQSFDQIG